MNKFKKILVLMLVLVVAATVFTVVSLADTGDDAIEKKHVLLKSYNYETGTEGSLAWEANEGGAGTFEVAIAANENRYIKHHVSKGSGNASYLSGPYQGNKSYSIAEYPYLTVDFDICKLAGDYAGAGINPYYYGNGTIYDDFGNPSKTLNQVTGGNATMKVSAFKKYLPTDLNTWAHVTIIFKYQIINDAEYIGGYVYVNGTYVYGDDTLHTLNTEYPATNYYFGTFRINNDGSTNTTNYSGYDNWQMNFFNKGYTQEEVVAAMYDKDTYELPYGVTIAKIGDTVYDRMPKAFEAFKPGDVIKLVSDVDGVTTVETPVTIDTNKYDENGNPTGEYYAFASTSTTLVSSEENGVIVFKQVQNASVQVYWDDCPGVAAGGTCSCPDIYLNDKGEHIMSAYTPSVMLNSVPAYTGAQPEFPIIDGFSKKFVGWSYTQGGEVEDLRAISTDDVVEGWIALYPVYEEMQYDIEVISSTGVSTYYLANEYDSVFSGVASNATIILHNDIVYYDQINLTGKSFTLDLNGFSFGRIKSTITDYEAIYDEATGEYIKGDQIADPVTSGSASYLFYVTKNNFTFNITSSKPGGVLATLALSADRWMYNGVPVKTDNVQSTSGGALFNLYPSNATYNITCEKGYLTIYSGSLFYGEHGGNNANLKTTLDGVNWYMIGSYGEGGNAIRGGGNHYFKNCTIVGSDPNNYLHKNASGSTRNRDSNFFFENCDISNGTYYSAASTDTFTFTNCRLDVKFSGAYELCIGEDVYLTQDPTAFKTFVPDSSIVIESVSEAGSYNKLTGAQLVLNPVSLLPEATPLLNNANITYKYHSYDPSHGPTNVIFKDFEGNIITEFAAKKNLPIEAPTIALGDGWRAVSNVIWTDASGFVLTDALGDADEYVFTPTLPEEGSRTYVSALSVAMMNMSYYSTFAYNVYVPVADGVTITAIGGEAVDTIVYIGGNAYYLYSVSVDAINALNDVTVTVEYAIGGQAFAADLKVSAYVYAMASVASDLHSAEDKEAAGALVRYLEEIYAYSKLVTADVQNKLDSFYAEYTPKAYVNVYPSEELVTIDTGAVSALIESVCFRVVGGSRIELAVTITEEADALGYAIDFGAELGCERDGRTFYTVDAPLYVRLGVYSIAVVNGEETVAATAYSMATYLSAMEAEGADVDLVKALYAFAKAVVDVRDTAK